MSNVNLRSITNHFLDVRLVSLASLRAVGEIIPRDRNGPYVVTQEGYDHILNLIPYKKVPREKVKLPKRSMKGAYDDQASLKGRTFVPEKY